MLQKNHQIVKLSQYILFLNYYFLSTIYNKYIILYYNYLNLYFYLKFFFKKKIFIDLKLKYFNKHFYIKGLIFKKIKKFFKKKYFYFINMKDSFNNMLSAAYLQRKWKKKKYLKNKKLKNKFLLSKFIFKKKIKIFHKLKYFTGIKDNNVLIKNFSPFSLRQRYFLVKKILVKNLVFFFLKNTKKVSQFLNYKFFKKKRLFLSNIHKKLVWKMHKARIAHWNFSTKGQLNKYRYNKLLAGCLNFITINSYYSFLIILIFSIYGFIASWKQVITLFKKNLIVHNSSHIYLNKELSIGDIIEFPFGYNLTTVKKLINTKHKIIKIKKETYKFLKRRKRRAPMKKIPKIYKNILFKSNKVLNFIAYDPILNIVAVVDLIPKFKLNLNHRLLNRSVIGLQNWRYEFQ